MKKLLFQLDTDIHPAVFDTVVAYDGGADHVIGYGNVSPENVTPLIEGTIFTRAPKEKQFTAIFFFAYSKAKLLDMEIIAAFDAA